MMAIHCSKALLDKQRLLVEFERLSTQVPSVCETRSNENVDANKDGSEMRSNEDASEMCSNEDASETCSNKDPHTFEWGPSRVWTRTLTRSNKGLNAFEQGSSHIRMRTFTRLNDTWTHSFRVQNPFALYPCVWRVVYQTNARLPGIFLFWLGAVYELRLVSYGHETVSKNTSCAWSSISGASVQLFRVWHITVRRHPDNWTSATVSKPRSKQKFEYRFLYLLRLEDHFSATKDTVVHLHGDTFGSPERNSARFGCK